ncbi:NADH-quinone oxidoreductase subunit L, partial [Candidatus Bathyarchaeota archaeon]|nr:NADH-quinone oxidoreductase subunit L [Candidatus Bathyarchaeota archaeon]
MASLGRLPRRVQAYSAVFVAAATLLLVASLVPAVTQIREAEVVLPWTSILGPLLAFRVDSLGLLFALVASSFGFVSILYSVGDMKEREGLGRYYTLMLIFSGSMLCLFLADNFLLFFFFWEIVGLCSYFLIGFDYSRESSRASAKALLITNYAGAFLLVGILLLYFSTGTLQISDVGAKLKEPVVATLVASLFLIAAVAKSAQFPLHVWLPDATVAPSAVTAYLHAAAMVKAGVYLVARSYAVFSNYLPIVSYEFVVPTIGVATLVVGTMAAWAQEDVKRVLAFSTVGQIGYIFLSIGLGTTLGVVGGLFHFLNHAFFKGLLFLCAGCLIHATGTKRL